MKMENDLVSRNTDKLQEISMKLEQSHLVYLQTDDSPLKLQQRHKLEGYITQYLYLVPNENKYTFQETADILHRSAATLQDFSGYRAVTAWSAISLYAANLLAQPWRKEYKILRTYSGYYKHEVEANLIGAELMFEQMGYKHTGLGILTLEGPIDPDKVSSVSRDAIVASVECQVLKEIWESVSQNYTISWLEVLEFRENHVGTPEQAIRALNYRFLEKMHQNHAKQDFYRDYYYAQSANLEPLPAPLSYQITPQNYSVTMPTCHPELRYIESTNVVPSGYRCFPTVEQGLVNQCNMYGCFPLGNKCYTNPYCATIPARTMRVPTDKLIEFDVPVTLTNCDRNHGRKSSRKILNLDEIELYRDSSESDYGYEKFVTKPMAQKDTHDSWDFVYKNLESQGHSTYLENRDDILRKKDSEQRTVKKLNRPIENDDKPIAYRSDKRRTARSDINDIEQMGNESTVNLETLPFTKKSSSFDLSGFCQSSLGNENLSLRNKEKEHGNGALSVRHSHCSTETDMEIADSLKKLVITPSRDYSTQGDEKWSCGTCTYLNVRGKDICEMCGKSRHKGNEDKPLASGGKECPQCTLVNEKDVPICDACGTSLKDSPTYI